MLTDKQEMIEGIKKHRSALDDTRFQMQNDLGLTESDDVIVEINRAVELAGLKAERLSRDYIDELIEDLREWRSRCSAIKARLPQSAPEDRVELLDATIEMVRVVGQQKWGSKADREKNGTVEQFNAWQRLSKALDTPLD